MNDNIYYQRIEVMKPWIQDPTLILNEPVNQEYGSGSWLEKSSNQDSSEHD